MSTTTDSRVRLLKTAFVVYYHVDLAQAKRFLLDFGLTIALEHSGKEIFFQGYGTEPYVYIARQAQSDSTFGGAAYVVESRQELETAHQMFGGSAIEPLDGPGGGEQVALTDPLGNPVYLIWGWQEKEAPQPEMEKLTVNYEDEKPRRGRFQRFKPGPALIHRWGHYGVTYPEGTYETMYTWYTTTLTLAPSDFVYRGDKPITCFFHIDRGLEYSDHHAFFFKPAKSGHKTNVAHAAFEVHDFDVQQLGHDYLSSQGYKICWGVGRHVLGSQVFDYWFDPSGFVVEHYADGDLVNAETPVAHVPAGPQALSVWGPPVPSVF
ncbi:Glyoxalase/Bleomycin resistance protein/Dihydroxybiphenyl dioxygenase [Aspergillus bertholletiae]|uniref:Glyoxalase/Bleomycin resistance protein/Dihydroxybiphenyl dioxygenase n=1 Tax=Aspergillus bertholletiae TaxID=1226010 RepID=A0A5N7AS17_9EURO|nr:Glyoxalase/Bleomycin resistance protein/Dihydroxybiphenyl dioxygenase [Aspergillus bertholletiae]